MMNKYSLHIALSSILTVLAAMVGLSARAAEPADNTKEVLFRCGKSQIDPELGSNREMLDSLAVKAGRLSPRFGRIAITGAASPEGNAEYNLRLSHRRAMAVTDYLRKFADIPDSIVNYVDVGRDWEGLQKFVEKDSRVPYRDQVVSLLEEVSGKIDTGAGQDAMARLRSIGGGSAYRYLFDRYFSPLRATYVTFSGYEYPRLSGLTRTQLNVIPTLRDEPLHVTQMVTHPAGKHSNFLMALKTNMLFDAALIPNIGAEFYLGKNLSVGANWYYGWWDKNISHLYWRYYGGDVTLRWWFGKAAHRQPLTGHHLGIYGGIFTFDVELGGKGLMGGRPGHSLWDRSLPNIGLEYGYSLPVARRLNIDFTVGIGYVGGHVVKYHPDGKSYIWDKTKRITWVGPAKAEISLVWLIGGGVR